MSQVFADGFESGGYAAWTSTTVTGTGTSLAVSGAAALVGGLGSRAVHNYTASDQSYEAKATKTFAPPPNALLYAQAAVRLTSVVSVGYGAAGSKAVLAVRAEDGEAQIWFSLRSGGLRLSYRARDGSVIALNSNLPVAAGAVVWLRAMIDRSGRLPVVSGWTSPDGVSWSTVGIGVDGSSGSQGVGKPSGRLDVGIVHIANFETGQYTVDYDEVGVLDSLGATDWRSVSDVGLRSSFSPSGLVDLRAAPSIRERYVQETAAGRDVLASPFVEEHVRMASVASVASFSTAVLTAALSDEALAAVERIAVSEVRAALAAESLASLAYEADVRAVARLAVIVHAVAGVIATTATVYGSDQPWGSVVGVDSAAGG